MNGSAASTARLYRVGDVCFALRPETLTDRPTLMGSGCRECGTDRPTSPEAKRSCNGYPGYTNPSAYVGALVPDQSRLIETNRDQLSFVYIRYFTFGARLSDNDHVYPLKTDTFGYAW